MTGVHILGSPQATRLAISGVASDLVLVVADDQAVVRSARKREGLLASRPPEVVGRPLRARLG